MRRVFREPARMPPNRLVYLDLPVAFDIVQGLHDPARPVDFNRRGDGAFPRPKWARGSLDDR